ncbi:stearoyl-CoA desaturase 5-like isoform X2 [Diabrotica virgifera virgifera]|uniref:Fatty acid desaturase domain-containing protein n=3 Tax=Diabrotica virgifera virgifera TaxID=50390 RepID=A0ABM5KUM2_DIAVI|nr:stearoyl-CoA desaturase 5-like isoform X2 [Diabrotica virgifera virgifera]
MAPYTIMSMEDVVVGLPTSTEEPTQKAYTNHHNHSSETEKVGTDPNFKRVIVWKNAIGFLMIHLVALYGLFLLLTFQVKFLTFLWAFFGIVMSGEGITMGAHRYYSHRTFKASFGLRLILMFCQTMAGQNCIYVWARDHRVHHKYSDTDADPHNANRGFFFSHMGWLMSKKHPLVKEKGKTIDMSDLEADPLVRFQRDWYFALYISIAIVFPVSVPIYFWKETFWNSLLVCYFLRNVMVLNQTWTVNSLAHIWGNKPFDKNILPSENPLVSFLTAGEGWHNYHHTFPWDYRTSEYGTTFTGTTMFIELAKSVGMAYDLKTAPNSMIIQRSVRTGDGTPIHTTSQTNGIIEGKNQANGHTKLR